MIPRGDPSSARAPAPPNICPAGGARIPRGDPSRPFAPAPPNIRPLLHEQKLCKKPSYRGFLHNFYLTAMSILCWLYETEAFSLNLSVNSLKGTEKCP